MEPAAGLPMGAIEASAFAGAMRDSPWLYPATEITHLVGIALLAGCVIAFDLRVLGINRRVPVDALARHLLPLAAAALVLVVPSGLAMFTAHASELVIQRTFLIKILLLFAAVANAVAFHAGPYRAPGTWRTGGAAAPPAARAGALLSIALWVGVIACGRLLAYT